MSGDRCITDRKRDFIKTLRRRMVSPAKLEALLMAEPEIAQAVVAGEGQPGLVALVVPADAQATEVAVGFHSAGSMPTAVETSSASAAGRSRRSRPSHVENGLLTPTMKVKRRAVLDRFQGEIVALYR